MVALLTQALMGMLSDRSRLSWGRRRPFILAGSLVDLLFIVAIGLTAGMEGMNGFVFLFAAAILLQISSNTAQSAAQGLIPDLVPVHLRGRFSGVKTMFELPIPLILVSFTIGRMITAGKMWLALVFAMGVLVLCTILVMFVPEKRPSSTPPRIRWDPFLRLVLMTGVFTLTILGTGQVVKLIGKFASKISSSYGLIFLMGFAGLVAMITAIGLGVWLSVRISVGPAARQNTSFTFWVINRLAFLVGAVNLSTFAIFFLQSRLGYEKEKAALPATYLMLFVGLFILASALPSGWLADRFGHKRMVVVSGFVAAFGTLVALSTTSIAVVYVGGAIIGLGAGLFYASNWALGTDLVPKEEAGRYLGISNLAGAGAGAVGAYIGGPIADYFTVHLPQMPGIGYVLLFGIYGSLFLLSTLALTQVREKRATPAQQPDFAVIGKE